MRYIHGLPKCVLCKCTAISDAADSLTVGLVKHVLCGQQLMSAEFEMNVRPTNPTGAPTQPPIPCGTTTTHCKCIHKFYMYREQVISNLSSTNCTASIIPLQRIGMICKQLLVTWMSACYQSVVCLTLGGLHQA